MAVDLFHSRRGNFFKCYYWVRAKEDKSNPETYTHNNKASGVFYARYGANISTNKNQINNVVMFDADNVTLITTDKVDDLTTGAIITFRDEVWVVDAKQFSIHAKESQYGRIEGETYISIRK